MWLIYKEEHIDVTSPGGVVTIAAIAVPIPQLLFGIAIISYVVLGASP